MRLRCTPQLSSASVSVHSGSTNTCMLSPDPLALHVHLHHIPLLCTLTLSRRPDNACGVSMLTPLIAHVAAAHQQLRSRLSSQPPRLQSRWLARGYRTMQQYPSTTLSPNVSIQNTILLRPGLDLWHALLECEVARGHQALVAVCSRCKQLLSHLCDEIEAVFS